jgi:hypothetical protein
VTVHLDLAMARDDKKITEDEKDDKKYEEKHNQIPKHKNVIKNYVNFELFHKKDKEDCVGWVTVMEKADRTGVTENYRSTPLCARLLF